MTSPVQFEDPRTVLKRYGLRPKHSWGQNFLISGKAIQAIVRASVIEPGCRVLEIGAGLGTLTGALLHAGAQVTALERDREMCGVLRKEFCHLNEFELLEADAAAFNYGRFLSSQPAVIVGNLPYQITGRILRNVLGCSRDFLRVVVMVQEEVANRIVASRGEKGRGILSVISESLCETRVVHRLAPSAFHPRPKVRSAIVAFDPRPGTVFDEGVDLPAFEQIVKAAFSCRRKTLRNSLCAGGIGSTREIDNLLEKAEIDPGIRPSGLSVEDFVAITKLVTHSQSK